MPIKPLFFLVFLFFLMSCGSSKQVVNSSETKSEEENTVINVQLETGEEVKVIIETEVEENADSQTEIDSTTSDSEEQIPEDIIASQEQSISINHNAWNNLLQKHVSQSGNVNYKGFKSDRNNFYGYIEYLQNNAPEEHWSKNDKLSYWINAYNAFTVDLILRNYPLQSIKDIKDPWDQRLWKIGSKWYNLNDIEHQILRKMNEPRIHFAIVCASVSCPKLQNTAFSASHLETQLTNATKEFISDSSKNIIAQNNIKLSKIFKWFSKDFKSKDSSVIDFLNKYASINISNGAKRSFLDYNWDLNE